MNSLEKITAEKPSIINYYKSIFPVDLCKKKISEYKDFINFKDKLNNEKNQISVIAEMKKSSPSAGTIIEKYNPLEIGKNYFNNGASCISILTEEKFFHGKLEHIVEVKNEIKLPILCKDFFIDPFQVYLAKSYGADSILIILAAVTEKMADQLYETALKLKMSVVVETHTKEEAKNSIKFNDALIGINNRNLKTLKTDINTTFDIHEVLINHKGPLISESGIQTKDELLEIAKKTRIQTFLIGESLLKNSNNNSIFSVL